MRGIGLRDRKTELMRVFGAPRGRAWGDRLVPESVPAPDFVGGLEAVKYPGISFTFYRSGRVASFVAYSDATQTARGVEVGDRLDSARSMYRAACKPEIETESDVIVAQCWKRLGPGRHIAFAAFDGSDKIGSIAVSAEPFPNGCEKGGFAPCSSVRRCLREALTGRAASTPSRG